MTSTIHLRDQRPRHKDADMSTLPERDPRDIGPDSKTEQVSTGLPKWLWKRLAEIAEEQGYSRNEAIALVLRRFADEYDEQHASKKRSK